MKGCIYYLSITGNTKVACNAISNGIKSIDFHLCNIVTDEIINPEQFDILGFATFVDWSDPSQLFLNFLETLAQQNNKPAFILCTYGAFMGHTLKTMHTILKDKGFRIVAGHSLHMPHSNPPTIAERFPYGKWFTLRNNIFNSPNNEEIHLFHQFIKCLDDIVSNIPHLSKTNEFKSAFNLKKMLIPHFSRKSSKKNMGPKYVDESLCNKCGVCIRKCPYHAIEMKEFPVFNIDKCFGCWACYNLCPKKAVYTNKLRDNGHYNISNEVLCKKLFIH